MGSLDTYYTPTDPDKRSDEDYYSSDDTSTAGSEPSGLPLSINTQPNVVDILSSDDTSSVASCDKKPVSKILRSNASTEGDIINQEPKVDYIHNTSTPFITARFARDPNQEPCVLSEKHNGKLITRKVRPNAKVIYIPTKEARNPTPKKKTPTADQIVGSAPKNPPLMKRRPPSTSKLTKYPKPIEDPKLSTFQDTIEAINQKYKKGKHENFQNSAHFNNRQRHKEIKLYIDSLPAPELHRHRFKSDKEKNEYMERVLLLDKPLRQDYSDISIYKDKGGTRANFSSYLEGVTASIDDTDKHHAAQRLYNMKLRRSKSLFPTLYPSILSDTQYKVGVLDIGILKDLALHSKGKINNKKVTILTGIQEITSAKGSFYIQHENIDPSKNWIFKGSIVLNAIKQLRYEVLTGLGLPFAPSYSPTLVFTVNPSPQPGHVDFPLLPVDAIHYPWILHAPLCEEGMWLNFFPINEVNNKRVVTPVKAHIPLGLYIVLRADVIHSGAMGSPGNVRFHMPLKDEAIDGRMLRFVTNEQYANFPSPADCEQNTIEVADQDPEYLNKFYSRYPSLENDNIFGLYKFL
jgi:hypothetical protein